MNYKQKYKDALEWAKSIYPSTFGVDREDLEHFFPELKESEDERIRKALIELVKCNERNGYTLLNNVSTSSMLAWLEKQGKETSWKPSKEEIEDDVRRRSTIQVLEYARSLDTYNQFGKANIDKNIAWLEKQGKSKSTNKDEINTEESAWHKDEKVKNEIKVILANTDLSQFALNYTFYDMIEWLERKGEQKPTLPKWKYKKDNMPLLRDSIILSKYGCVAKSPSGAIVSDVWVIDYAELAKLPKEESEKQGEQVNCPQNLQVPKKRVKE